MCFGDFDLPGYLLCLFQCAPVVYVSATKQSEAKVDVREATDEGVREISTVR